jgi:hypothetical protein
LHWGEWPAGYAGGESQKKEKSTTLKLLDKLDP